MYRLDPDIEDPATLHPKLLVKHTSPFILTPPVLRNFEDREARNRKYFVPGLCYFATQTKSVCLYT